MAVPDLDRLFEPSAIALVGASADPEKLAGRPLRYLEAHGYGGDIHLVNPRHDEIDGRPCHDSVTDVPARIDLALVLVPAPVAATVVRDCGEAGVPFAVVVASGFGETGEGGEALEADLLAAAHEGGVRLVGPNSEGLVNVPARVGASFSSILKRDDLLSGPLAVVTQSGAFGGALFQVTQDRGVGASVWLSTGNEADLTTLDALAALVERADTVVVAAYVEALEDAGRLPLIGRRAAETGTALVAMRAGRSVRGRAATASHTGSVASDDAVYDALFRQSGVARVDGVDAFADAVTAFARLPQAEYPRCDAAEGQGVGVVSVSGGAAALIADAADRSGLPLATFERETRDRVARHVPDYGAVGNPVDVTGAVIGDPTLFEAVLRDVAGDPSVTALLLQFGNSGGETVEACEEVLLGLRREGLCVATVFTGGRPTAATRETLIEAGVLVFGDPARAVATIDRLARRAAYVDRAPALPVGPVDRGDATFPVDGWDAAAAALAGHGVETVATRSVPDADAAVAAARDLGYPVVLKVSPLDVAHKTEIGGVRTGLADAEAVRSAFDTLRAAASDAELLVQAEAHGVEALVGVVEDPDVGPVLTLGPGGTLVEVLDDVTHRGLPVDTAMVREMVAETALGRLLEGVRGGPAADVDALCDVAVGLTGAFLAHDVTDLECNPVVVSPTGATVVDLLVR